MADLPTQRIAMDRPSIYFAHLLDNITVEEEIVDRGAQPGQQYLVCQLCAEQICSVDNGDTMRVLLNTALAHTC